jgi:hypothetical protein
VAVLAAELDSRSALGKDLARIAWRNIFSWRRCRGCKTGRSPKRLLFLNLKTLNDRRIQEERMRRNRIQPCVLQILKPAAQSALPQSHTVASHAMSKHCPQFSRPCICAMPARAEE